MGRRSPPLGLLAGLLLAAASVLLTGCYIPVQGVRDTNPPAGVSPPWPYQADAVPPAPPRDPLRGQGETPPPPQGVKPEAYADWLFEGPEGRGFSYYLAQGYRRLAKHEDHQHDFANAAKFLARAASADRHESVSPELLYARVLPLYAVDDLAYARQRLVGILNRGAAARFPRLSAEAQVLFDCWMEQQEENIQPQDVARCRSGFEGAMARLEAAYREQAAPPPKLECAPATCPPPPCMHCPENRSLLFDLDQAVLTAETKQAIAEVAKQLKNTPGLTAAVGGHTDRSGTDKHNDALSKRRLDAVVEALLAAGARPEALARTHFYGETRPRVPTPDGVRLQDNRRVEIHFLCGQHGGKHHASGAGQCANPMRAKVGPAAQ
jgi:OOP family OmpA-OmpF porin